MAMQMRRVGGFGSVLETLVVSASLSVTEGCPIDAHVHDGDAVSFTFGGAGEPAEIMLDAESLRSLLELGGRALGQMDTWQGRDSVVRLSAKTR